MRWTQMDAIKELIATGHHAMMRQRCIGVQDGNLHAIVDASMKAIRGGHCNDSDDKHRDGQKAFHATPLHAIDTI